MLVKYRSKTDVIARILEVANGNWVIQTKILYEGLLSYSQLKEYLLLLIENDLLEYKPENQTYKTSEKGLRFLDVYHNIDQLIK